MASIYEMIRKLRYDEEGATAIEYGLIAGLLAVAIVTILGTAGENLTGTFTKVSNELAKGK
ncbi:MAG: Flp family type IVb pilin [Magnetospirillum sp.]|nr:Flp family type IVb pilin [Magnetospirillum sp.]